MKQLALIFALLLTVSACENKPAADTKAQEPATEEKADEKTDEKAEEKEEPAAPAESSASKKGGLPENLADGETKHFGDRFTVIEPAVTLASALEKSADHAGPYKVEATMEQVCKKKGCWFTLAGEGVEKPVRVRMKDYGFFVPRNANGAKAVVEGTIAMREIPQEEAQHYADEAVEKGEEPKKVEGPEKVFEFTATAVEVTMPAKG